MANVSIATVALMSLLNVGENASRSSQVAPITWCSNGLEIVDMTDPGSPKLTCTNDQYVIKRCAANEGTAGLILVVVYETEIKVYKCPSI